MSTTWSLPAILGARADIFLHGGASHREDYLTAIVWTKTTPVHESAVQPQAYADLQALRAWLKCEKDLSEISKFEKGWNGLDAAEPNPDLLKRAEYFLHVLRERFPTNAPMRVVLSSDGLIAFEWAKGNSFVQAEIGNTPEVEWMFAIPGQPTGFEVEQIVELPSASGTEQRQEWQPVPAVAGELACASGQ